MGTSKQSREQKNRKFKLSRRGIKVDWFNGNSDQNTKAVPDFICTFDCE
jgi:hypothetical protein